MCLRRPPGFTFNMKVFYELEILMGFKTFLCSKAVELKGLDCIVTQTFTFFSYQFY